MECQYELTSFGIPHTLLPVDEDGKIKHAIVNNYIESQRRKDARDGWKLPTKGPNHPSPTSNELPSLSEQLFQQGQRTNPSPSPSQTSNSSGVGGKNNTKSKAIYDEVDGVNPNDVLMGRGIPFQTHPGNLRLAKLIEEHAAYHNTASRFEKVVLTWKLVNIIKESGGRFLAEEKGDGFSKWKEVDDPVARTKVSYGFRSLIKMKKEKRQKQQRNKQKIHK